MNYKAVQKSTLLQTYIYIEVLITLFYSFFYNHFVTIFRTLMSFFKTLETKLTTNDQNGHILKL